MLPDRVAAAVRVLATGPALGEFSGGIQTFVELLLGAFRADPRILVEHFAITLALHDRESWSAKLMRNLRAIVPYWRRISNCEVVHLNSTFDDRSVIRDMIYVAAARARGRTVILQFHGGDPRTVRSLRIPLLGSICRRVLKSCEIVLVLSRLQQNQLADVFPAIAPRVRRVPNFIDPGPELPPDRVAATPVRFLFLGRLHATKGLREIVEASRLLAGTRDDFAVHICGDGPERAWLEGELSDAGLRKRVVFHGVVRGRDKARMLAESHVLLLPTRHNEGFPFVVLEAFAAGLALIASPAGAIPDIMAEAETGHLVPSGDALRLAEAMLDLMEHPTKLRRMSLAARSLVERNYSVGTMRTLFRDIYVCSAGSAGSARRASACPP